MGLVQCFERRVLLFQKLPGLVKLKKPSTFQDSNSVKGQDRVQFVCDGENCPVIEE